MHRRAADPTEPARPPPELPERVRPDPEVFPPGQLPEPEVGPTPSPDVEPPPPDVIPPPNE